MTEFAILFKFLRERTGMSARALSLQAGLSQSYISKVESGNVLPTIESFAKIIKLMNITDKELMYLIFSLLPKDSNES